MDTAMNTDTAATSPDHQALKVASEHMGQLAWPTAIYASSVLLGYALLIVFTLQQLIPLWAVALGSALLTYLAYTTLHESAHNNISGKYAQWRWLNEALGYLSAMVLCMPLTAHRVEHLAHHRFTNDPDTDPDAILAGCGNSPIKVFTTAIHLLIRQYSYYLDTRWGKAPTKEKCIFLAEVCAAITFRGMFIALGLWQEALALFVIGNIGGLGITLYLFAYIVHHPHTQTARYEGTSTIRVPGKMNSLLTGLWVYQNYHSIHHLFPKVPFYRYRQVFDRIEPIMREKNAPVYRLTWRGLQTDHVQTDSCQTD
ncbi:MAG: hypothetical protein AseanaTS_01890 [Candidatus Pelagadaptatus aseana]